MYKLGDPNMNRQLDKANNIPPPKPIERVKQEKKLTKLF